MPRSASSRASPSSRTASRYAPYPVDPASTCEGRRRSRQDSITTTSSRPEHSWPPSVPSQNGSPSTSAASRSSEQTHTIIRLFIGNSPVMSKSQTWKHVLDPGTQRLLCTVPECTMEEIQHAVEVGEIAQPEWAALGFQVRREYLLRLIESLRELSSDIVMCLCREVGKTISDADTELFRGLDSIQTACSIGPEMAGMFLAHDPTLLQTFHDPVGVCCSITPFTFPFMIPLWSIPYALITGNTVILKPSEKAPTVSGLLAAAFLRAGFPPGVFNILHGGPSVVNMLISQAAVQAISFVGSETAGRAIHDLAHAQGKRVQAECSGKNHGVVLPDAPVKQTLFAIAGSAFGAAGQRCMSMSVAVFVGEARGWIPQLVDIARLMIVGYGEDVNVKVGPLIDALTRDKVFRSIEHAAEQGATILLDGRDIEVPGYPHGNFMGPTILTDVDIWMDCYRTEILGPVLICLTTDTLEEAVDFINQNKYGNGCSIFTSSPKNANVFQHKVNIGHIGVNIPLIAPYGLAVRTSNKASFLGERNIPGRTYWPFFTMTKTVSMRWD